jgi:hypothetical protein
MWRRRGEKRRAKRRERDLPFPEGFRSISAPLFTFPFQVCLQTRAKLRAPPPPQTGQMSSVTPHLHTSDRARHTQNHGETDRSTSPFPPSKHAPPRLLRHPADGPPHPRELRGRTIRNWGVRVKGGRRRPRPTRRAPRPDPSPPPGCGEAAHAHPVASLTVSRL